MGNDLKEKKITIVQVRRYLDNNLLLPEQQYCFGLLFRHTDFACVFGKFEGILKKIAPQDFKSVVRNLVEQDDIVAYAGRAVLGSVATGIDVLQAASEMGNGVTAFTGFDIASSVTLFLVLGGLDIYRWGRNELTTKQLVVRLGEHALGVGAGTGGALLGGMIGSLGGPVLAVIGALLGGFLAAFSTRVAYRKAVEKLERKFPYNSIGEAENEAARQMGIILPPETNHDTFKSAKMKFRKLMLETHPDHNRAPNATEETAALITAWMVVRGRYERLAKEAQARGDEKEQDSEGFNVKSECQINMWSLMKRGGDGIYRRIRIWIGKKEELSMPPTEDETLYLIEHTPIFL
jgi:hypothetical protein